MISRKEKIFKEKMKRNKKKFEKHIIRYWIFNLCIHIINKIPIHKLIQNLYKNKNKLCYTNSCSFNKKVKDTKINHVLSIKCDNQHS